MLGKRLHIMMPVFQLRKNYEGQNIITCSFLAYYSKLVESNGIPSSYLELELLPIQASFGLCLC